MKHLIGVAGLCALAGCYWSPTNLSNQESTANVSFSGFSLFKDDVITLTATNLTTGVAKTIGAATASGTALNIPDDGTPLYPWSLSLNLAADYWAPQLAGGLSTSLGRLEILGATSSGYQVYSFSSSQLSCEEANLASLGPVQAAEACGASSTLVVFDNDGVGTPANSGGLTPLDFGTYNSGTVIANWEIDSYTVNDGAGSRTVYAYVCYPSGAGPFPVQIYNHPGYTGLYGTLGAGNAPGPDDLGNCINAASEGWVTAMSAYRGEPLTGTITESENISEIEACLGEVTDVLQLTNLVLAKSYANANEVLMWGYSHGGCITDRAIEQGAPVQAAATFAAMTDTDAMNVALCGSSGPSCIYPFQDTGWQTSWGYTPTSEPIAYKWRSPVTFAEDLYGRPALPFLMLQGVEKFTLPNGQVIYSDKVLQQGAACELASLLTSTSTNVHLSPDGDVEGTTPPDCTSYGGLIWQPSNVNPLGWTKDTWPTTTLVDIDEVDHFQIINNGHAWTLFMSFVAARGWGTLYPVTYNFAAPAPITPM